MPSRQAAQEALDLGRVLVGGAPALKASRMVAADEPIVVEGPPPRFVSRGGEKLDAALATFEIDVAQTCALDAGASTGGFTDCLLQRGAARVVALDVGHGQLHAKLRADPRVEVVDRTNVRHIDLSTVGGRPFDTVVADLSFISLATVAPKIARELPREEANLVFLVKPQFEAGRAEVSRGKGVVRDAAVWRSALAKVRSALDAQEAAMMGVMVSPLRGADGNVEFLLHARAHAGTSRVGDGALDAVVDDAMRGLR